MRCLHSFPLSNCFPRPLALGRFSTSPAIQTNLIIMTSWGATLISSIWHSTMLMRMSWKRRAKNRLCRYRGHRVLPKQNPRRPNCNRSKASCKSYMAKSVRLIPSLDLVSSLNMIIAVDTRAAHLDRSRVKAALQQMAFRVHYGRDAALSRLRGPAKPRNIHGYFRLT